MSRQVLYIRTWHLEKFVEPDTADLLGHTIQSITGTYAGSTPEALEDAVNRLTEPRGVGVEIIPRAKLMEVVKE